MKELVIVRYFIELWIKVNLQLLLFYYLFIIPKLLHDIISHML